MIAVLAGAWLLPGLGNGMLWQDEAQTALLARTTLAHGVPIAFDGVNSISQEGGDDYGPHGWWKWHMWLPFYVLAGFFKLFGQTTAIARLPFALFGVATAVLCWYTALALWNDFKTAAVAVLLLLMCISFVLLVRQCRYYSPAMFFSLLMLYAYLRMIRGFGHGWILLTLAGVLLFNSHFLYCATAWAAILIHAALWHRRLWRRLLSAAVATLILCLPPVIWLASLNYRNYSRGVINAGFTLFQLRIYCTLLLRHVFPWPLLLIIPVIIAIKRRRFAVVPIAWQAWSLPLFFCGLTVLIAAPFTPGPAFRYLGPLIVPFILVIARLVILAFRASRIIGIATAILLAWWWPITDHVYELNHPFVGPMEGIVDLLRRDAKPGDVVVISYGDLPLKFYTPLRIVGGLTGEDLSPGNHARWLVLRRNRVVERQIPVEDFIRKQMSESQDYEQLTLSAPDTPFENREDPDFHLFATAKNVPPVIVYRRKTTKQNAGP